MKILVEYHIFGEIQVNRFNFLAFDESKEVKWGKKRTNCLPFLRKVVLLQIEAQC